MNKIIFAIAAMVLSVSAFAGGSGTGTLDNTSTAQQQQQQAANSTAINGTGNTQGVTINQAASIIPTETTQHIDSSGSQTLKNTPSVSGSPLTSSNDTCMGSASGAINGPGFGIGLGKTYTDSNCVMLKNAREMWNMGFRAAALARMCGDADNKDAFEMTGFECPQTTRAREQGKPVAAAASQEQYNDPIVRARLGLAPLAK